MNWINKEIKESEELHKRFEKRNKEEELHRKKSNETYKTSLYPHIAHLFEVTEQANVELRKVYTEAYIKELNDKVYLFTEPLSRNYYAEISMETCEIRAEGSKILIRGLRSKYSEIIKKDYKVEYHSNNRVYSQIVSSEMEIDPKKISKKDIINLVGILRNKIKIKDNNNLFKIYFSHLKPFEFPKFLIGLAIIILSIILPILYIYN